MTLRKNSTLIYHVELIIEKTVKQLIKKPKFGKSVDWYEHVEDRVEVDEELEEMANRKQFSDEIGSNSNNNGNNGKNKNNKQ